MAGTWPHKTECVELCKQASRQGSPPMPVRVCDKLLTGRPPLLLLPTLELT